MLPSTVARRSQLECCSSDVRGPRDSKMTIAAVVSNGRASRRLGSPDWRPRSRFGMALQRPSATNAGSSRALEMFPTSRLALRQKR